MRAWLAELEQRIDGQFYRSIENRSILARQTLRVCVHIGLVGFRRSENDAVTVWLAALNCPMTPEHLTERWKTALTGVGAVFLRRIS